MEPHPYHQRPLHSPAVRGILALVALVLFIAAAVIINPFQTRATTVPLPAPQPAQQANTRTVPLPALIGTLIGVEHTLEIFVTRTGIRYTVKDRAGRTLAEMIEHAEIYERFPELDLSSMHAEAETETRFETER